MSLRRVAAVVGLLQVFVALSMVAAGVLALFYRDGDALGIFDVSWDGNTLAFVRETTAVDIWVLEAKSGRF